MNKLKREHIYLIFIISIIICIFQYGIHKICGFTIYPDEFGYWASAAKAVGYEWSEVASLGSYYSFGYSLLLIPLLKLLKDGVTVYRAAVAVNMLLMCLSVPIVYRMICRLFPETDNPEIGKIKRVFISGIAIFYPSWIFYMQMTLAEALLMFLFTGLTCLFISFVQKPKAVTAVLLAIGLIYSYCVHMRTVAVVIACLLTMALWGMTNPAMRKPLLIMMAAAAAAGLAVVIIKRNVILSVFTSADTAVNDYGSQIDRIRNILAAGGVKIFIKEIIGKFFYLGMATYGLFYWSVGWCLKETAGLVKNIFGKKVYNCTAANWTAMFLLLTIIGEILICSIFMHGSMPVDSVIYGRYNEFLVPVLMVTGIVAMLKSKWIIRITLLLGTLSGVMVFPIRSVIEEGQMSGIRGYFVAGISYLLNREEDFNPDFYLKEVWIVGFILMVLTAAVVFTVKKRENMAWLLGIVIMLETGIGIRVSEQYAYRANRFDYQDLIISEKIMESGSKDVSVFYLDEGMLPYVDFQQMQLRDISINVISGEITEEMAGEGDFLIVSRDTQRQQELEQIYNRYIVSNLNILYYNETD
ncbi:MAG: hypothetical protein K2O16_00455 [Lachnospiraceae bacterium]|nr:hypothetical protein [Lachnospiraceae bacterium]